MNSQKILITGTAGFIGFHVTKKLTELGNTVIGIDSINNYYDVNLKYSRLSQLGFDINKIAEKTLISSEIYKNCSFVKMNIENKNEINTLFNKLNPDIVINLAAQAGVRYSLENPDVYINSNIVGFLNILEACRNINPKHLIYASSSSVYGLNKKMPLSVSDNVDHPISLYAATKKSNELMAHTYSYLFNMPSTGLRFFTVYGPWGRPDMALFLFTKAIIENKPISIFNNGQMIRDFTYIDDIVEGIVRIVNAPPKPNNCWNGLTPDPATSVAPYRIFNIGNSSPVNLMDYIEAIEKILNKKAIKTFKPMQPGDVQITHADTSHLEKEIGYKPSTPISEGINKFIEWYLKYYHIDITN